VGSFGSNSLVDGGNHCFQWQQVCNDIHKFIICSVSMDTNQSDTFYEYVESHSDSEPSTSNTI
jgi:hypothetical protein